MGVRERKEERIPEFPPGYVEGWWCHGPKWGLVERGGSEGIFLEPVGLEEAAGDLMEMSGK